MSTLNRLAKKYMVIAATLKTKWIEQIKHANSVAWGWEDQQYRGKDQLVILLDPSGIDGEGKLGVDCPATYGDKKKLIDLIQKLNLDDTWVDIEEG